MFKIRGRACYLHAFQGYFNFMIAEDTSERRAFRRDLGIPFLRSFVKVPYSQNF